MRKKSWKLLKRAIVIIEKFEEWDLSVKWLIKFAVKIANYVNLTIIPDIKKCHDDRKNIVALTERFIYMFNSLLAEYEFLTEGKTEKFKMHKPDNNTGWSHTHLDKELTAMKYKKLSAFYESQLALPVFDIERYTYCNLFVSLKCLHTIH